MRGLILCLAALCCGAALARSPPSPQEPAFVPTLPEPPAGLTEQQTRTWNAYRKFPSSKSIKIISFDPGVLNGNSITVNQDAKSYTFKGQSGPNTLQAPTKAAPVEPVIIWKGRSEDGRSEATVIYNPQTGVVSGSFVLDGKGNVSLSGPANAAFWVEQRNVDFGEADHKQPSVPAPESSASGVQK